MENILNQFLIDYITDPSQFEVKGRKGMIEALYPEGFIEVRIKKAPPALRLVN